MCPPGGPCADAIVPFLAPAPAPLPFMLPAPPVDLGQCQMTVVGVGRCPERARHPLQVHAWLTANVCDGHDQLEALRARVGVYRYAGGERPDIVVLPGLYGNTYAGTT